MYGSLIPGSKPQASTKQPSNLSCNGRAYHALWTLHKQGRGCASVYGMFALRPFTFSQVCWFWTLEKETMDYMKAVKKGLEELGEKTFMVDAKPGQSFAKQTLEGLVGARVLVAFCTADYGEKTGVGYETFVELRYAYENHLPIIPLKLCTVWPPQPPDLEGKAQNRIVFTQGLVYIEDIYMKAPKMVAEKIEFSLNEKWISDLENMLASIPGPPEHPQGYPKLEGRKEGRVWAWHAETTCPHVLLVQWTQKRWPTGVPDLHQVWQDFSSTEPSWACHMRLWRKWKGVRWQAKDRCEAWGWGVREVEHHSGRPNSATRWPELPCPA